MQNRFSSFQIFLRKMLLIKFERKQINTRRSVYMPVFEATLNKDSQAGFIELDLSTVEETRRQDLQQIQSRDLFAVTRDARRSSGTQHESGEHNFSYADLLDAFS